MRIQQLSPFPTRARAGDASPLVLIIEDHEDSRELLRLLFQAHGFSVAECDEGHRALAEIERWRPDLIVLDGRLQGEDGWSICRRLRSGAEGIRNIPVIFTSAVDSSECVAQAFAAGCNLFFSKPFDIEALLLAATELLATAGRPRLRTRSAGH